MQPKLIWLALLSNNWSFASKATRFHKNFSKFLDVFVLVVPSEFLLHYINIDSSKRLTKDVHWIRDKVFREKRMVQWASTLELFY